MVAGGDGSIAPVAAAAGAAGIPLAVVPAGTANDFAGRLGLPVGAVRGLRLAVRGHPACASSSSAGSTTSGRS